MPAEVTGSFSWMWCSFLYVALKVSCVFGSPGVVQPSAIAVFEVTHFCRNILLPQTSSSCLSRHMWPRMGALLPVWAHTLKIPCKKEQRIPYCQGCKVSLPDPLHASLWMLPPTVDTFTNSPQFLFTLTTKHRQSQRDSRLRKGTQAMPTFLLSFF